MNPLIQLKTTPPLLITLALLCFGLSPTVNALLPAPAPDGGYPGGNTAEGVNALHDVNTAVGINNTAVGANALTHDTTGNYNVAVGSGALQSNTTGNFNMAIGTEALRDNNANFNLAIGFRVLFMNTTGSHLTGIGAAALRNNTTASDNTAIGADAMRENTTGKDNTAIGADALAQNSTGHDNTANGFEVLLLNTSGANNTANGVDALAFNNTGSQNTANGAFALFSNTEGQFNTAVGYQALFNNITGTGNIALGASAGGQITIGSNNIDIGNPGGAESSAIRIGLNQTKTFVAGINGVPVTGTAVMVDGSGQLGVAPSSKRFKEQIKPMDNESETILALKPVTFHYKKEIDSKSTAQFGLVAEEVEKINPDLVVRDANGSVYSVRYDAVNAMLLNEFLKEHRTVQELKSVVAKQEVATAEQQKQIEALTVNLQKVSALVETIKPAPQVVNNP